MFKSYSDACLGSGSLNPDIGLQGGGVPDKWSLTVYHTWIIINTSKQNKVQNV